MNPSRCVVAQVPFGWSADSHFEEKAFYDVLKSVSIKYDFAYQEDKLIALSKAVKVIVKVDLILVLAEHGYPPVANDEVYREIFEQAENFKRYRFGN